MIAVDEAEALIAECSGLAPVESVPLEHALGRFLAAPVVAERDHPPFDRITHDGVALASATYGRGARTFPVRGYAAAGAPRGILADPTECIEVATGAPLPSGCDCVVPYEAVDLRDRIAHLSGNAPAGQCVHAQGSDARQGQALLTPGCRIGIAQLAVLASNGYARVPVYATPSVGLLATGNELVAVDGPVAAHQIRRSNDTTLRAALVLNGFEQVASHWVPDDRTVLSESIAALLASQDVLFITGGVSRGTFDYVPGILSALGVIPIFHGVAQRPGKPLWFGRTAEGKLVFGLPGNPVSCLVCLTRYGLPPLRRKMGVATASPMRLPLAAPVLPDAQLTLFRPAFLDRDGRAAVLRIQNSGDFTALLPSTGFIALPPRDAKYEAGESVAYYPWCES